ncbi:MAG: TolC family protein [Bacteroidota bacterium]
MKKNLLWLLLLLTTLAVAQNKPTVSIGVLVDSRSSKILPLYEQLKNEVKAVVGEDATVVFPEESLLFSDFSLETAQRNYDQLITDDTVDLIIAFGAINNQIVSKQTVHPKPTILFGAVNRDYNYIDLDKTSSGIENFTYLIASESFQEDLKTFKELTDFQNLGVAMEASLIEILPVSETFDKIAEELEIKYKLLPFTTISDITNTLEGLDAIYMAGGFFLTREENQQLARAFIDNKLPSFSTNGPDDVVDGMLATTRSNDDLDQFFRRIALTVEAYISGAELSELDVYIEYTPRLTMNFNTADAVEVPIKYSLINKTDFVGDPKNVLAERRYNLINVIEETIARNLSLQSNQKDVDLTQQDVRTAWSNYLPDVTASGTGTYVDPDLAEVSNGQNPEFSTSGAITLNQTLYSEAANANITIQKKLQQAEQENFNASQLDAILDASTAYFNILILKANTAIQLRNLNLTQTNLKIAEQNFDAGESGKSDMLRFRSEMAQNQQSLIEAINQLEQGFIVLNQVLNNPLESQIDVEDVILDQGVFERYNYDELKKFLDDPKLREPFIGFLTEEAFRNAPELKSLGYNIEAVERNIRLSGTGRLVPTVALQGSYNSVFNRSGAGSTVPPNLGFGLVDNSYNASLSLSLPIFNQNTNNINKQIATIQRDQLEINKDNTELAIDANVRNGVLNLINQVSNIELSGVSEETAAEALELTQSLYTNGAVNIVQLLDAQNNYLNAQLARVNAVYNFLISSQELERSLGYFFLLNTEAENEAFRQRFFEYINTRN